MDKFIVFSDLHLHNWTYGASYSNGWNSRLTWQSRALSEMTDYAIANDIHDMFFTGDFFHTHESLHAHPLRIANLFIDRLRANGIALTSLVGNHDMATARGEVHTLDFLSAAGNVVDEVRSLSIDRQVFYCLPYMNNKDAQTAIPYFLARAPKDSIVLMHQGVANVAINSKGFIIKDEVFDVTEVPDHIFHCFVGHYHSFKHVTNKVTIPGSLMQHTWADFGEKRGFLVVELNPKQITQIPIVSCPTFRKLDMGGTLVLPEAIGFTHTFVKVRNVGEGGDRSQIREMLLNSGALSVEFEITSPRTMTEVPIEKNLFELKSLVESFMLANDLDADLCEVGKLLMEFKDPYEGY